MSNFVGAEVDQAHFDLAWDARERTRATLRDVPQANGGNQRAGGMLRKDAERMLAALGAPDEAVAFGRMDLADGEGWYVGKRAIADEGANRLVISWQSPFAEPYHLASYTDPRGLERVRRFATTRNRIDSFEELIFADLAERVGKLTEQQRLGIDDALLKDLEADRSSELRDIAATIHASQYELMSLPLERLVVVQGGPGTGKTVVALHRVSWLLYNFRDPLQPSDVLVVGPSQAFANYIKQVLPGLGDYDVNHRHLRTLGPIASDGRPESVETARLKGDARMEGLLQRGLRQRVRLADAEDYLPVEVDGVQVRIPRADVDAALADRLGASTYSAGRTSMRQWIADRARSRSRVAESTAVDAALERVWPQLTAQLFMQGLLGSRNRLTEAAGDDFTAGDINRLYRQAADRLSNEQWSDSDVALLDEADFLIHGTPSQYGHIVIDEAQDLSPMQLRSIRRRSVAGSYTIVGDIAQSTGTWAREDWSDIVAGLADQCPVVEEELEFGYRVPRQIFDLAGRLLPYAAPSITAPRVVRDGPSEPTIVDVGVDDVVGRGVVAAGEYAGLGQMVGIICPDSLRDAVTAELSRRGVRFADAAGGRISGNINLLSPEQSKGLEFDAVVLIEPAEIAESGLRFLYIAMTRATRYLTMVESRPVPELADVLPGFAATGTPEPAEVLPGFASVGTPEPTDQRKPALGPRNDPQEKVPSDPEPRARVRNAILEAAAAQIADDLRDAVREELWPSALARAATALGMSDDDLIDALIEARRS